MTVVAEVIRNGFVESVHHGRVVALDGRSGRVFLRVGDADAPVLPRSALKPLQALAMLRLGWAPADDEQIALACASHSGEPAHLAVVRRILDAAGLDESALDNATGMPLSEAAARDVIRAGGGPERIYQNCSGKHAAMLATCVVNGWPREGYRDLAHPLQQAVRATIEDIAGESVDAVAVDGCGAPAFALSIVATAATFATLVTAAPGTPERRVADAMRANAFLVGGTDRDVTNLMQSLPGFLAKDGAEGVYAAATSDGVGVAVKIDDGSGRARTPVLVAALQALGVDVTPVAELATVPVLGHGDVVGAVRPRLDR